MVIADASVAPHHAELVVLDDGRLYLTDCATAGGTWRVGAGAPDEAEGGGAVAGGTGQQRWVAVRQAFVREGEALRLGDHRCTAGELVRAARGEGGAGAEGRRSAMQWEHLEGYRRRLRGRVERDAATGEIVRRRP